MFVGRSGLFRLWCLGMGRAFTPHRNALRRWRSRWSVYETELGSVKAGKGWGLARVGPGIRIRVSVGPWETKHHDELAHTQTTMKYQKVEYCTCHDPRAFGQRTGRPSHRPPQLSSLLDRPCTQKTISHCERQDELSKKTHCRTERGGGVVDRSGGERRGRISSRHHAPCTPNAK